MPSPIVCEHESLNPDIVPLNRFDEDELVTDGTVNGIPISIIIDSGAKVSTHL